MHSFSIVRFFVPEYSLTYTTNSWGLLLIEQYENVVELLKFDIFYNINGRFPYTTGLLSIPDGDSPSFLQGKKYP